MTVSEGVDFELSEDQQLMRDEIRRFAAERIQPEEALRDREHRFAGELVAEMAELGLFGMLIPEEYGGAGVAPLTYCLAVEQVSRISPSIGVTMSVSNSVCCWPIVNFATDEVKARTLPRLAAGALGALGLTEPGSGSDVASLATTARRDGDSWVLDGEKAWITNAGKAAFYVVMAKTDREAGKRGISAFVVPADAPGFSVGKAEEKLGLRSSLTAQIFFNQCRIPLANLLGSEGQGMKIALATLDHSRLGIAAQALGIHQRALDLAVAYAKERKQFGVPIAQHQAIQFQLAEMATALAASRALTYAACTLSERHKQAGRWASQAKLLASEAANKAAFVSQQIHGGNGFSEEYEIARLYRDVRVTTVYEGTSEMQRLVIARHLMAG